MHFYCRMFHVPIKHHIFIDGLACMGKTSWLQSIHNSMLTDYHERTLKYPMYLKKHTSFGAQAHYTSTFSMAVTKKEEKCIWDRSPISDIFYDFIFRAVNGEDIWDELNTLLTQKTTQDLLANYPTVFIVSRYDNIPAILNKMIERANGLDMLKEEYVYMQIKVFIKVIEKHPRCQMVNVYDIYDYPANAKMMTDAVLDLDQTLCMEDPSSSSSQEANMITTEYMLKAHPTDAGFDLHAEEDVICKKLTPVAISYREKIQLPTGYMAYLQARSSLHKIGMLQCGVIDAGYCGKLTSTFFPYEDFTILQGQRIAQVVIHPVHEIGIEPTGRFLSSSRGVMGHGSSGQF